MPQPITVGEFLKRGAKTSAIVTCYIETGERMKYKSIDRRGAMIEVLIRQIGKGAIEERNRDGKAMLNLLLLIELVDRLHR